MHRNHRRLAALACYAALASVVAATACGSDAGSTTVAAPQGGGSSVEGFRGVTRAEPFEVGATTLPEVTPGSEGDFSFTAPPGEVLFVFFGYTHCPDVCPTTLSYYKAALEALGPDKAAKVNLAMVAIDPERDTAEVMDSFLSFYADDYHAIRTTDMDALAAAEADFGTTSSVTKNADGTIDVVHSGTAYLVDDQGRVIVELPFGVSAADMQHDLELAIAGADA